MELKLAFGGLAVRMRLSPGYPKMQPFFCFALGVMSFAMISTTANASRLSHHTVTMRIVRCLSSTTDMPPHYRSPVTTIAVATWRGWPLITAASAGSKSASGARINPGAMTAAHRSLPFGTKVRVTNQSNGRSVVVTINDRGPFVGGPIIDVSSGAAGVIGMKGAGVARVSLEVVP